ncbi:MAG TPA: acid phosphatase [Solirubrobacteraceae bacterium]
MRVTPVAVAAALALALPGIASAHGHGHDHHGHGHGHRGHHGHGHHGHGLKKIDRIVVIYEENHSFDNVYGGWEGVDGLGNADPAHTKQVNQAGTPYTCLLQNDVNLTSPPLSATCHDATTATPFDSHFTNDPFRIDDFIPATAKTCPAKGVFAPNGVLHPNGLPGGCTRDLVHRYYQEQYQLNGGQQNRYVTGSDAVGLTMGTYDTRALPIYKYLHAPGHPAYAIADRFFQAAFGGSFLNHQWLIAAATPTWPGADNTGGANDLHSVVDSNGMPTSYPLYKATSPVNDGALTASCHPGPGRGPTPPGVTCGDFAVNTIQPPYQPFSSPTAAKLPPQTAPTIGDRLSAKGVDWAWYSGGWSNANGDVNAPGWTNGTGTTCTDPDAATGATFPNCPDKLFQYHHQPFNYFASFAPGTAARAAHLRDEAEFVAAANDSKRHCELKPVSFVKPIGEENEHPGYASESSGSSHLVELLSAIRGSACARDTMVVVTYDEFGGQWDHVSPPGQGGAPGPHDIWGPSTRIPALVLAPHLRRDFVVDHTQYDTTSIMATIERRFGLRPVSSRDRAVNDLSNVFRAGGRYRGH